MWNDLVTTALLGTERRALKLDDVPEPLRDLAAALADAEPERALLALAGALALYRRAGQMPGSDTTPALEPSAPDDRPACSPRAGQILGQIMALTVYAAQLPEWITAAADAGQRVSAEYLPRFLSYFERRGELPARFFDVLGQRGRWLAQQNENWAYAVLPADDTGWEFASLPARLHYLRRLRAADPARGRALVASVWQAENADSRGSLLEALRVSLSRDDEPFLEAALDDRAASVGLRAAGVLRDLPGSAYQQRMMAQAQAFLRLGWKKHRLGHKLAFVVSLPEAADAALIRDGIDPKPATDSLLATRAYWLHQIALALPAAFWLGGDWTPGDLVQAVSETDEQVRPYLEQALAQLGQREPRDDLAQALLASPTAALSVKAAALSAISEAALTESVLKLLELERGAGSGGTFQLLSLERGPRPWNTAVSAALLRTIAQALPRQTSAEVQNLAALLPAYALRLAPGLADSLRGLAAIRNKHESVWANGVKRAVATLDFRRDMLKEFSR